MAETAAQSLQLKEDSLEFSVQEGSTLGPIDLKEYIDKPDGADLTFSAELLNGDELPKDLSCNEKGILTGTLTKGTARVIPYNIVIVVQTENLEPLVFDIFLQVATSLVDGQPMPTEDEITQAVIDEYGYDPEKLAQYWSLFSEDLELPDLEKILTQKIRPEEIYHLLSRFATLTVWNADLLEPAEKGQLIELKGASEHYRVNEFEKVALVASPKDLYSTDRTLADAIQTAKALIQEAHSRKWNVELTGFDKMVSAAWVEANYLNRQEGAEFKMEVKNYSPSPNDVDHLTKELKPKTIG